MLINLATPDDILIVKKKRCPEYFPDYDLDCYRGSQGKFWRLQNGK